MGGEKVVFAEAEENVGLADAAVANDKQFGEIIIAQISSHFDFKTMECIRRI